jgi:hypothetical protein
LNNKIILGIAIAAIIAGASAVIISQNNISNTTYDTTEPVSQNDKVGLVMNTVNPPKTVSDIEHAYQIAATSGIGRTNLYVHWNQLEPEEGIFDWQTTDILMSLHQKYNIKTTLFFSVINADRLGPFPDWMGNQLIGKSLENNTIRVLDEILSRYENNIDYVIFAGDIDYHFQRATGTIPEYTEFFNNVSSKIKENHPYVKIGNTLSLENVINKDLVKGGQFELIPQFEMGDFVAFSYKPTDIVGDIARTPDYTPSGKESIWPAIDDFKKTLEMFPDTKIAFFEITWSTSNFINGSKEDQKKFIDTSFEFYKENQSEIEFFTWARLFDKPKGTCVSDEIERVGGSDFSSNSFRLERIDEYMCNSGLIDTNENAKPAWNQFKKQILG